MAEIAELATAICKRPISKQLVWQWRNRHADFPEPIAYLAMGKIFSKEQVTAWIKRRISDENNR